MHLSLLILFFFTNPLSASSYDDAALEIIAKILPRFVLMSSQKNIKNNYPNGIKGYPITFRHDEYADAGKCQKSQIAFMFDADEQTVIKAIKILNRNGVFTMAYNPTYLEDGVQSSLFFGRKVVPYINFDAMQQNGIMLDNALVQVSKIYSRGDGK